MIIRTAIFALVCAATPVWADVPQRLESAFRTWAFSVGADAAVMSIWRGDTPHGEIAIGMAPDTPVELASLSKAITALCAAGMIVDGTWQTSTTSAEVLGYGPEGLTVGALMTHSAGLGPDQTQGAMQRWLDRRKDRADVAAEKALNRAEQTAERGSYSYNNENYAVLASMISARTGQPHTRFCQKTVLDRAGVSTARLSPRTGSMAGWGGWMMSVADYARLVQWAYGPEGMIGKDPSAWPQADMGGGMFYGVGMTARPFQDDMNYWHFGLLCFPGRLNAGTYAVSWISDWRVVVAYDRCVSWDDMIRLDNSLTRAVFQ